jgi:hypothetical protein
MTKRTGLSLLLGLALALVALGGTSGAGAQDESPELVARMYGANEVPGPADPDGTGRAWLYEEKGQACYTITWRDIDPPTAAHIHRGRAGVAGPVVAPLFMTKQSGRRAESCTSDYDSDLVAAMIAHPSDYYVNLHNDTYPNGAIRGQLRAL